jgi:hypothetical protein
VAHEGARFVVWHNRTSAAVRCRGVVAWRSKTVGGRDCKEAKGDFVSSSGLHGGQGSSGGTRGVVHHSQQGGVAQVDSAVMIFNSNGSTRTMQTSSTWSTKPLLLKIRSSRWITMARGRCHSTDNPPKATLGLASRSLTSFSSHHR